MLYRHTYTHIYEKAERFDGKPKHPWFLALSVLMCFRMQWKNIHKQDTLWHWEKVIPAPSLSQRVFVNVKLS